MLLLMLLHVYFYHMTNFFAQPASCLCGLMAMSLTFRTRGPRFEPSRNCKLTLKFEYLKKPYVKHFNSWFLEYFCNATLSP